MNAKAASASNLINAIGFEEFMNGVQSYDVGAQLSIPGVLGDKLASVKENGGSIVTLGKLIRNNVENGNLSGLEPLQTLEGTAKKYKVVGKVKMKRYFSVDWSGKLEDPNESIQFEPRELFVFCTYKSERGTDEIELKVHTIMQSTQDSRNLMKKEFLYKKHIGNCGFTEISADNQEFPAIQAVWFGFDRVAGMQLNNELDEIDTIYFIGTNPQMMRRIAGCYFGVAGNSYDYTRYIQDNFFQFLPGELRGIDKKLYLAACEKAKIDTYIQK